MPKLGEYQYLLDIVFFLYPDEESARAGKKAGGTGFFVAVPSATAPDRFHFTYAVTNWHVAVERGSSVIRVNRHDGGVEIFPFEPHEWEFIPGGHDIAAIPLRLPQELKAQAILFDVSPSTFCLTKQDRKVAEINAGDDVFMLGRFVDYDGVEVNQPAMRFGNISMMSAKVKQPTGGRHTSVVVDMHSRTGFSGSPVFVYRTHGSIFAKENTIVSGGHLMKLHGILWGQFPEEWGVKKSLAQGEDHAAVPDVDSVIGWSGMSLVVPAHNIAELLNCARFKKEEAEAENGIAELLAREARAMDLNLPKA